MGRKWAFPKTKREVVSQPPVFRGKLLVLGRVYPKYVRNSFACSDIGETVFI